jgi:hypothetical protein
VTGTVAHSSDDEPAAGESDALAIEAAVVWHASLAGEDAQVLAEFNAAW